MRNPPLQPAPTAAEATPGVVFDFEGALHLARRLVAMANDWEHAFAPYQASADAALAAWSGPHRDRAAERVASERRVGTTVGEVLRTEALRWATAWADAADELQRQRWAAATVIAQDGPPLAPPPPVAVPLPPAFEPTVELATGSGS